MNEISFITTLSKNDLKCCICFEYVNLPLIHCNKGNHFVCNECFKKTDSNCPVCRTNILIQDKILENGLKPEMSKCNYSSCKELIFPWNIDNHENECQFRLIDCPLCKSLTNLNEFAIHLKSNCVDLEYLVKI
jgi:hypothetical protein